MGTCILVLSLVLFDVVVVVVVVKVGVSIPALLLGFLYYVQVGTLKQLRIVFRLDDVTDCTSCPLPDLSYCHESSQ